MAGFTALPAGWYNYYETYDDLVRRKVYRTPCPGVVQVQTDYDNTLKAAEFNGAAVQEASSSSSAKYLGTFYGEEYWEEFGTTAPNENLQQA
jgi:hypothetical protein